MTVLKHKSGVNPNFTLQMSLRPYTKKQLSASRRPFHGFVKSVAKNVFWVLLSQAASFLQK